MSVSTDARVVARLTCVRCSKSWGSYVLLPQRCQHCRTCYWWLPYKQGPRDKHRRDNWTGPDWRKDFHTEKIFRGMHNRCENPNDAGHFRYGGRGIKVCPEWSSYEAFIADMGLRPKGKSIDRIDNNLGYSKENCRWATRKEQQNNLRSNRYLEFTGERKTIAQWADSLALNVSTIHNRLARGWSVEKSLSKPRVLERDRSTGRFEKCL